MSVLLSGLLKPFPDNWEFTGNALYHNSNEGNFGLNWTLLYSSKPLPIDMFGSVEELEGFSLTPWQFWNPTDLKNPDRSQIIVNSVGQGKERSTSEQRKLYLDLVYNKGHTPTLIVSVPDDNLTPAEEGGLVNMPSALALRRLPGNDPSQIPVFKSTIINENKNYGTELWQTVSFNFPPDLSQSIENLIWLAYFP